MRAVDTLREHRDEIATIVHDHGCILPDGCHIPNGADYKTADAILAALLDAAPDREALTEAEIEQHVCCLKPRLCKEDHFHQKDVERIIADRALSAPEGCDCTELCSMGPTCPGGMLAGLPRSGCWRTDAALLADGSTAEPDAATVKRAADAIGEALNGLPFLDAQQESRESARMVLARAALRAAPAEGGSDA